MSLYYKMNIIQTIIFYLVDFNEFNKLSKHAHL